MNISHFRIILKLLKKLCNIISRVTVYQDFVKMSGLLLPAFSALFMHTYYTKFLSTKIKDEKIFNII